MNNDMLLDKPANVFKTFPEFSKLTLADRGKYEALVKRYPPLSDLGFPTLMFWWNSMDSCAIAQLNGNLVISYWLPGLEAFSGLALIGETDIEQSMCEIFDWQRSNGERPRLTHIPEFVIKHIQHPDMFACKAEREFDEYIYKLSNFYPLENMEEFRKRRIDTFIQHAGSKNIVVKPLALNEAGNMQLLLEKVDAWRKTGNFNDSVTMEVDAIHVALRQHDILGMKNICLFVDGVLQGFCLYYLSHDGRYAIVTNARINTDIPWTLDYAAYVFSRRMSDDGATFINMECDLGSQFMRTFKLSLGPTDFFRKYTIEPAS